jgi:diguanylate cyclase (GGDEF)-like protein/PAS domain S-box-containing protein
MDDEVMTGLVDVLPDAVLVVDTEATILWGNRAAERLSGRTRREAVGTSCLDLLHPEDLEATLRALTSVQGKEVGAPLEVRLATPRGWRLMEVIGTPVTWTGRPAIAIVARDLTDRRRFEIASTDDARLRTVVQNSAAVTMLVGPDGRIESTSGAFTRVLGHDQADVEGTPLVELAVEEDRAELAAALRRAGDGSSASHPATAGVRLRRRTGPPVPFDLRLVDLVDDPTVGGYVVSGHDATARALAEHELHKALSLLTATLDATADGILVVDNDGRFTSYNQRFVDLWHLPPSVLASRDDARAVAFVLDQLVRPEEFAARIEELYLHNDRESHDVVEFLDGRVLERTSRPQRVDGEVVGRVWSFRDVTDRKRLEERLSFQAFHDPLTGLGNRALFQDRLQHALARVDRTHEHLAVLFLDLDRFKEVNDRLGHSAGDALLRSVADVLLSCLRAGDTAARLGGDEFGILVEDVADPGEVTGLADRLLDAVRRPVILAGQPVRATASIGLTFDGPGLDSDELIGRADAAMYSAKAAGRDRWCAHGAPAVRSTA